MGFTHSEKAIDLLIALWHGHKDYEDHSGIRPTGPQCQVCKPLHYLLGWSWEEYKRWVEKSIQPERKERNIGTRGIVGVIVDGVAKTSYNHYDSYPESLGVDTLVPLRLLAEGSKEMDPERRWPTLAQDARKLRMIDERGPKPTAEDKAALARFTDLRVGEQTEDDWYCLTRKLQGYLGLMLSTGYMVDAGDFPLDSLFCEWGYIVNFDELTFEVYEGFQKEPHNEGFWGGREPQQTSSMGTVYYSIRRVASWPLDELPTKDQFLAHFHKADDGE